MTKGEGSHGSKSPRVFDVPLIASALFVLGTLASRFLVEWLLARYSPAFGLDKLGVTGACAIQMGETPQLASMHLYAAQTRWSALFLLLVLASVVALAIAVATVVSTWRENPKGPFFSATRTTSWSWRQRSLSPSLLTRMSARPTLGAG